MTECGLSFRVFALHGHHPSSPTYLQHSRGANPISWRFSSAGRSQRRSRLAQPFRTFTLFRIAVGRHLPYSVRSTRVSLLSIYLAQHTSSALKSQFLIPGFFVPLCLLADA